jgi:hypothetical protein
VPVVGPLLASRTVGMGMRPVIVSVLGAAAGGFLLLGPRKIPPPPTGAAKVAAAKDGEGKAVDGKSADGKAVDGAAGELALARANAAKGHTAGATGPEATKLDNKALAPKPDTAKADAAKADALKAESVKADATKAGVLAAQPIVAQPTTATTPLVTADKAGAPVSVVQTGATTVVPRDLLLEGTLNVTAFSAEGAILSQILPNGAKGLPYVKIQIAAAITSPPSAVGAPRQLYLGGAVTDYSHQMIDRFGPYAFSARELESANYDLVLPSRRGLFQAVVRVDGQPLFTNARLQAASLSVQVR